jgi:GrpB-like predicted nucleotidyltransferase (UPF0157 family)
MNDGIVVVDYNPEWPAMFEKERRLIAAALAGRFYRIEHFGSTSIPGIAAKPVIDILVLVENLESPEIYSEFLSKLDYIFQPFPGEDKDHIFLRKGSPRTHHLHIVKLGGREHMRHIGFRDYLRTHPEVAREYEALKKALARKYANNREAYTNSKTSFVREIEARILPLVATA